MPKLVLILFLALSIVPAAMPPAAGQDMIDFGDPLPLPPPPIDDAPPAPASPALQSGLPAAPPAVDVPGLTAPAAPAAASASLSAPPLPPPPPPVADSSTTAASPAAPSAPPIGGGDSVGTIELPDAVDPSGTAALTVSGPETPIPGRIAGGRVNVRAGPNTQYESIAVITTGAPVTVLSKHAEWYKIVYPADQLASIHKNFVTAEIEGEIPEAGVTGIVNQDKADVHAFYWDKSTVVGQLNKGDPVTIKQERGQWYRIAAPETARAFVFAEYVKVDGTGQVPADSAPAPVNPAVDLAAGEPDATGRLKLSENDRRAAELKEAYFTRIREQQRQVEEEEVRQVNRLEEALDSLEARLRAVDTEISGQLSYPVSVTSIGSSSWAPPDPLYGGFTGWVENIGRVGGFPASHRLSKGGEIRFYLQSGRYNLDDFVGRRVWVNGNIDLAAGAVANILNVEQIRVLTESEIAEGMTAPPGTSAAPAPVTGQFYSDPFGPTVPSATYSTPYDPYASPASDPYAGTSYQSSTTVTTWDSSSMQTPQFPTSPQALPDQVGYGAPAGGVYSPVITGSPGEVSTDYFESPIISEVGP